MTAKETLKSALMIAAYAVGGVIVYALMIEFPKLGYAAGAVLAAMIVQKLIKEAVREVLTEELAVLRRHSHADTERLETAERKISAVLGYILEIRRGS